MFTYSLRRLAFSAPLLLLISLVIFLVIDMAPNDPTAQLPLSIPPELREEIRKGLGLDQPTYIRYLLWCKQFFVIEPMNLLENWTGWNLGGEDRLRVQSWSARAPVVDLIAERLPQTLWVVGLSYLLGILIALPVGLVSAYRQYGWFDQISTFVSLASFSVPTFFTGLVMIVLFSVKLNWFPSVYDTTHQITDLASFGYQIRQMVMPVTVLAIYNAAQISRYMRASALDNLHHDYVRTARAKGLGEGRVLLGHVMRNSILPVITVIALGAPQVLGGAIITEQVFKINGLGQLLISAIQSGDVPLVQTLAFLFAVLIVMFNLAADIIYGVLDPRIRYD